jgi:hypothetical protein
VLRNSLDYFVFKKYFYASEKSDLKKNFGYIRNEKSQKEEKLKGNFNNFIFDFQLEAVTVKESA